MLPVPADATRLTRVLVNLLSNAATYNQPQGRVTLSCEPQAGQTLKVSVSDTGLGMDAGQQAQLFEPFNRLGRETSTIDGTGIGLVITRRLLALMHSDLSVQSSPGVGSTFSFDLPQACAPIAAQPATGTPALAGGTARGRVLYVEDNEVNATLMREVLRQRPGVDLVIAETASEGLRQARLRPPDLILLDMHLPDADGHQILDELHRDAQLRELPVVAISADATHAQKAAVLERGVRDYLTKPINVAEVLASLDQVLAAPRR